MVNFNKFQGKLPRFSDFIFIIITLPNIVSAIKILICFAALFKNLNNAFV